MIYVVWIIILEKRCLWDEIIKYVRESLKIDFHFISSSGIFYAANASDEFVNFVNEHREFSCLGNNVRWLLPNRTEVTDKSSKYQISTITGHESKLKIFYLNPNDIGQYRCVSDVVDQTFDLKLYCEFRKCSEEFYLTVGYVRRPFDHQQLHQVGRS